MRRADHWNLKIRKQARRQRWANFILLYVGIGGKFSRQFWILRMLGARSAFLRLSHIFSPSCLRTLPLSHIFPSPPLYYSSRYYERFDESWDDLSTMITQPHRTQPKSLHLSLYYFSEKSPHSLHTLFLSEKLVSECAVEAECMESRKTAFNPFHSSSSSSNTKVTK